VFYSLCICLPDALIIVSVGSLLFRQTAGSLNSGVVEDVEEKRVFSYHDIYVARVVEVYCNSLEPVGYEGLMKGYVLAKVGVYPQCLPGESANFVGDSIMRDTKSAGHIRKVARRNEFFQQVLVANLLFRIVVETKGLL
jgi:hypothetical protein